MLKAYTQVFAGNGANGRYLQLARVLRQSSGDRIAIRQIEAEDADLSAMATLHGTYLQNTRKTRHHAKLIDQSADGDVVALFDADMLILRAIDPGLLEALGENDIAITYRAKSARYEFNSGLFVTRVSPLTRALHNAWVATCESFLANARLYRKYASRFGGINQSSLACTLEQPQFAALKIARLSTLEWNATVDEHALAERSGATRVVHVLGALRRDIYCGRYATSLGKIWRAHADNLDNRS